MIQNDSFSFNRNRPSNLSIQDKSINFAIRLKDVIEKRKFANQEMDQQHFAKKRNRRILRRPADCACAFLVWFSIPLVSTVP